MYLSQHQTLLEITERTEKQEWYQKTVNINTQEHFSIGFEAVFGKDYVASIGLDDILFKECSPGDLIFSQ